MINLETNDWNELVDECMKLISAKQHSSNWIVYDFIQDYNRMKKYGLRKTKAGSFSISAAANDKDREINEFIY